MPSWSFQLEGQVFDGVEIVSASHMDVKNKVINPDYRVCRFVVCPDVYGFEPLWKFMIQHLIGEAQGVCDTPVFGCVVAWVRWL